MDWGIFGVFAGWVVPAILGGVVMWVLDRRPRLVSFFLASSAVTLKPAQPLQPGQSPTIIHTHTIIIRNRGRKAATNIRLGHNYLPAFSVSPPSLNYSTHTLPSGEEQIVLPVLPPHSQVQINYLYFPPLVFHQIHAGISSDDGSPSDRGVVINPKRHPAFLLFMWLLAGLGFVTLLTGIYVVVTHLLRQ